MIAQQAFVNCQYCTSLNLIDLLAFKSFCLQCGGPLPKPKAWNVTHEIDDSDMVEFGEAREDLNSLQQTLMDGFIVAKGIEWRWEIPRAGILRQIDLFIEPHKPNTVIVMVRVNYQVALFEGKNEKRHIRIKMNLLTEGLSCAEVEIENRGPQDIEVRLYRTVILMLR